MTKDEVRKTFASGNGQAISSALKKYWNGNGVKKFGDRKRVEPISQPVKSEEMSEQEILALFNS